MQYYDEIVAAAFEDELVKIASEKIAISPEALKTLGILGAGAVTFEALRRANEDRRMGRMMRMQQQNY